jgi:hypothetical protein
MLSVYNKAPEQVVTTETSLWFTLPGTQLNIANNRDNDKKQQKVLDKNKHERIYCKCDRNRSQKRINKLGSPTCTIRAIDIIKSCGAKPLAAMRQPLEV